FEPPFLRSHLTIHQIVLSTLLLLCCEAQVDDVNLFEFKDTTDEVSCPFKEACHMGKGILPATLDYVHRCLLDCDCGSFPLECLTSRNGSSDCLHLIRHIFNLLVKQQ